MKTNKKLLITMPVLACLTGVCSGCGVKLIKGDINTDGLNVNIDTRGANITLWTGFGSDMSKELQEVLDEFEAKTQIHVEHESKGGYPNLLKAINLASTSGTYPNVANGYPDHFASYVKSDIICRLDGLLANDAQRYKYTSDDVKYGEDNIMLMDYKDFYTDYTVENETLEFKEDGSGYVLGLPFNKSTECMVYNAALFDWAKNSTAWKDKIFVPTTWAEVKSVGLAIIELIGDNFRVVNDKDEVLSDGNILSSDGNWYPTSDEAISGGKSVVLNMASVAKKEFHPFTYDATANFVITLIRQYGGNFTEVDKSEAGRGYAVFNTGDNKAKTVEALTMMKDLFDCGVLAIPATYGELYCSNAFKATKSVMNISSTAGLANITSTAIPTKCAPIPQKEAATKAVISQGTSIGLFNKGTEKEKVAAWKLMIYLSQQANGKFAAATGYFPTCNHSANSIEYLQYLDNDLKSDTDVLRQASALVNQNEYVDNNWNKFVDPGFRGSADIRDQVDLIPGFLMTNEKGGVQQTLDYVYSVIADYVK